MRLQKLRNNSVHFYIPYIVSQYFLSRNIQQRVSAKCKRTYLLQKKAQFQARQLKHAQFLIVHSLYNYLVTPTCLQTFIYELDLQIVFPSQHKINNKMNTQSDLIICYHLDILQFQQMTNCFQIESIKMQKGALFDSLRLFLQFTSTVVEISNLKYDLSQAKGERNVNINVQLKIPVSRSKFKMVVELKIINMRIPLSVVEVDLSSEDVGQYQYVFESEMGRITVFANSIKQITLPRQLKPSQSQQSLCERSHLYEDKGVEHLTNDNQNQTANSKRAQKRQMPEEVKQFQS